MKILKKTNLLLLLIFYSFSGFQKLPRTFIPIMWAEERVRVTPEIAADIALVPLIVLLGQLVTGILLAVGVIMICWYPTKFITQLWQDPKGKSVLLRPLSTTASVGITKSPTRHRPKEQLTLLERNNGVNLLRATGSSSEGLLNNTTANQRSSSDVINS